LSSSCSPYARPISSTLLWSGVEVLPPGTSSSRRTRSPGCRRRDRRRGSSRPRAGSPRGAWRSRGKHARAQRFGGDGGRRREVALVARLGGAKDAARRRARALSVRLSPPRRSSASPWNPRLGHNLAPPGPKAFKSFSARAV
jgi:hypothetical protein